MNWAASWYRIALLLGLVCLLLAACNKAAYTDGQFTGSWVSSRTNTPIHILAEGSWEIKAETGETMQSGGWEIKGDIFVWAIQQSRGVLRDPNRIMTAQGNSFELREQDGSTTRFRRVRQ